MTTKFAFSITYKNDKQHHNINFPHYSGRATLEEGGLCIYCILCNKNIFKPFSISRERLFSFNK